MRLAVDLQEGLFYPGTREVTTRVAKLLASRPAVPPGLPPTALLQLIVSHRLQQALLQLIRISDLATDMAIPECLSEPVFQLFGEEYAEHRRMTDDLKGIADPNLSDAKVIKSDMRTGFRSGNRIGVKLVAVLAKVVLRYGGTPTIDHLQASLGDGHIVPASARQKGKVQEAFERIACGCRPECYSTDFEVAQAGPHGEWLAQYDDLQQFASRHAIDMWYDATKFAMFGPSISRAEMGLAFNLGRSIDPRTGVAVEMLPSWHRRLGCPILSYDGSDLFADQLVGICAHPAVWDAVVEAAGVITPVGTELLLPRSVGNRRFAVADHMAV